MFPSPSPKTGNAIPDVKCVLVEGVFVRTLAMPLFSHCNGARSQCTLTAE
jgi:hypothetical protein